MSVNNQQGIDLTPDIKGMIAFARKMQREAPSGSADQATARKILLECGVDPDAQN